jgi:hypothetical protein
MSPCNPLQLQRRLLLVPVRARQPAAIRHRGYPRELGPGLHRRPPTTRMQARRTSVYLNGARVAQMSDTQPIDLNSAALGIGRHVSGIADPLDGHIDEFRIVRVQRSGDLKRRNGAAAEAEQRATCLRMASGTGAAQIHPCRGDRRPVLSGIRHRLRARIDRPPSRAHPDPCCGHSGISDQTTGSTRLPTLKAPAPRVSRAEANLVE